MQQDKPLIVWGWAQSNEKVTVELAGGSQQVQANDRGEWKAVLPERGHGKGSAGGWNSSWRRVRGLLRLGVGLGSEPDEGARTWPLWPCRSAPAPQST